MEINVNQPQYYTNRELSWLQFDERILDEARDPENPLFERLKFLSISSSNLDEFFMVRVASLKDMIDVNVTKPDLAGMKPTEQLKAVIDASRQFVKQQGNTFTRMLIPALQKEGLIIFDSYEKLSVDQRQYLDEFFEKEVYPVLTPMAVDPSRPFPLIRNKSLNICVMLSEKENKSEKAIQSGKGKKGVKADKKEKDEKEGYRFATVQIPQGIPRLIEIPGQEKTFFYLEKLIEHNIGKLFENQEVLKTVPYRITRNADMDLVEDEASDLLKEIQKQLRKRQRGEAIRLEIEEKADDRILQFLKKQLEVEKEDVFHIHGPIDLTFLMKLYGIDGFEHLKEAKYIPADHPKIDADHSIFDQIREGDILLHHPYQSFEPVLRFVAEAAVDEKVLAIKQTLYRVSGNSPIVAALAKAAENGKQVTVLVELKARFDEENNIQWAKQLEKAGCHVIYGLLGLKTHSKITLVVRREEDGIRRYVHLGTGNYNDATAKLYTDMGLLTCKDAIGEDATAAFNMISGYSEPKQWNKLSLAPYWLRNKMLELIKRETQNAKAGKKAKIIAKMNSLCDQEIIAALYEASGAGVEISLIVRGICCLKTDIPGVSENIKVRSIVGSFLEHSRIYYFYNNGREEVYMSSADWMPRNLDKRVEILFPVEAEDLKMEVLSVLDILLKDNLKARILHGDQYERASKRGNSRIEAQKVFCELAKKAETAEKEKNAKTFTPVKASKLL